MSRVIAYIMANAAFWLGHAISYPMRIDCLWRLYTPYNWLMCKSIDIQDEYGLPGPWRVLEGEGE